MQGRLGVGVFIVERRAQLEHALRPDQVEVEGRAQRVTLSLDAGIAIPVIPKIVGNTDVRVLLKHYHKPSKKTPTDQMTSKLPTFLTATKAEPSASVRAKVLLENMNAENWQLNRAEVLKLLNPTTPETHFRGTLGGTPA